MPFMGKGSKAYAFREEAVKACKSSLETLEAVEAPKWLITLFILPVFIYTVVLTLFKVLVWTVTNMLGALFAIMAAPFVGLFVFVDLLVILYWFSVKVVRRLSGEEEK